ncbi:MAG: hypothetical protein U9N49_08620, partial [Campylobacterota bacterium]|nr:hypothetical protein [Campylobacterota bacterium]
MGKHILNGAGAVGAGIALAPSPHAKLLGGILSFTSASGSFAADLFKENVIDKYKQDAVRHLTFEPIERREEFRNITTSATLSDSEQAVQLSEWYKNTEYSKKVYDSTDNDEQKSAYINNLDDLVAGTLTYCSVEDTYKELDMMEESYKNDSDKSVKQEIEKTDLEILRQKQIDTYISKNEEFKAKIVDRQNRLENDMEEAKSSIANLEDEIYGKAVLGVDGNLYTGYGEIIDYQGNMIGQNHKHLKEIDGKLVDMDKELKKLGNGLDFTQELLYGILPNAAKRKALENPDFLSKLKPKKRAELLESIEIAELKDDILYAAGEINRYTQGIATITANLGIGSAKDQKRIAEIANIVGGVSNAVAGFTSGNYLGGVMALSGLFAKPKEDPDQKRFEAIMNALGAVDKKLDKVLDVQVKTIEAVYDLHNTLIMQTDKIYSKLDIIAKEQQVIKTLTRDTSELDAKVDSCRNFLGSRYDATMPTNFDLNQEVPDYLDFEYGSFTNSESFLNHF